MIMKFHIDLEKYKHFDSVARRELGFRIYERMDELGMNLEDLRLIMGYTSNSQPYRIINGECGFHIEKLYLLAQALDASTPLAGCRLGEPSDLCERHDVS